MREGLVEVRSDTRDRRTKHGTMTAPGRQRYQDMIALWTAADQRVEAILGADAAEALRHLADTVASERFRDAYSRSTAVNH